jgi:hypothetical protein
LASRASGEGRMSDRVSWETVLKARLAELAKKHGSAVVLPEIHVSRGKVVAVEWHNCGLKLGRKV